jgi:hypothetical protein
MNSSTPFTAALLFAALTGAAHAQTPRPPAFSQTFEEMAPASKTAEDSTLPANWSLATYGDGPKANQQVLVSKGKDGSKALRFTVAFGGLTYWGAVLSSPAIPTEVPLRGVPEKFTLDVQSAKGGSVEITVHSQDASYGETGTLSRTFPLKAGEWTTLEFSLRGGSPLGNFSVLDPNLVLLIGIGNNNGYGPKDTADIQVDNIILHSVAP